MPGIKQVESYRAPIRPIPVYVGPAQSNIASRLKLVGSQHLDAQSLRNTSDSRESSNPAHTMPLHSLNQIDVLVASETFSDACHAGWSDMWLLHAGHRALHLLLLSASTVLLFSMFNRGHIPNVVQGKVLRLVPPT